MHVALYVFTALAFAIGMMLPTYEEPRCFEDEAIVWENDSHSKCVPLEDLVGTGCYIKRGF